MSSATSGHPGDYVITWAYSPPVCGSPTRPLSNLPFFSMSFLQILVGILRPWVAPQWRLAGRLWPAKCSSLTLCSPALAPLCLGCVLPGGKKGELIPAREPAMGSMMTQGHLGEYLPKERHHHGETNTSLGPGFRVSLKLCHRSPRDNIRRNEGGTARSLQRGED